MRQARRATLPRSKEKIMGRRYFGTDGVRGKVGEPPITPEFVMHLGYAAGRIFSEGTRGKPAVLLGKDTRISGYLLEAALTAGFTAAGVDVHVTGPIPTPAIAYLTRGLRLNAGVVLSASHNPYEDNGIKFFSADGNKLPDEMEEAIEALLDDIQDKLALDVAPMQWPSGSGRRFKGVMDVRKNDFLVFPGAEGVEPGKGAKRISMDDSAIGSVLPDDEMSELMEGAEMAREVCPPFNDQSYREGHLTPVYFGSALRRYGVRELIDALSRRTGAGARPRRR